MKKILMMLILGFSSFRGYAEQSIDTEVKKSLVIISSTKDYSIALKIAKEASKTTAIPLNLRDLLENKKTGLSFDKKICMEGPIQEYPCYQKRGKFDDGKYISIEYSSDYKEMTPKLYIVIIYSGEDVNVAKSTLEKVKSLYKDAFLKNVKIYMAGE
jgi:hypothetical protein